MNGDKTNWKKKKLFKALGYLKIGFKILSKCLLNLYDKG
jgi:hypothetical protein